MRKDVHFSPAWWLPNRHLQSCFSSIFSYRADVDLRWEEMILPDGDFIDVVWAGKPDAPIVILLHGLEGSVYSHYIQLMLDALVKDGWQAVVMHYRTCSGRINRLPQSYNGGDIRDLIYLIKSITKRFPQLPLYAVGFSLGGNILMHYLARNHDSPLQSAVAVSTPFELSKSADYLVGFYQRFLLRTMKYKVKRKIKAGIGMPVTLAELEQIYSLREFDSKITAPLSGYQHVEDYYDEASCRYLLANITHPLLIIHALDDPFIPEYSVPEATELGADTILELSNQGGHVGFITGDIPWRPVYWVKDRIMQYLNKQLEASQPVVNDNQSIILDHK